MASPPDDKAPVDALIRLTALARCLRSTDGRLYIQVPVDGRREVYAIRSSAFSPAVESHREYERASQTPQEWRQGAIRAPSVTP